MIRHSLFGLGLLAAVAGCHRAETPATTASSPAAPTQPAPAQVRPSAAAPSAAVSADTSAVAGARDVVLKGVIVTADSQNFLLANAAGLQSRWTNLGETYRGWKLAGYQRAEGVLSLQNGRGEKLSLTLAAAGSAPGNAKATVADAQRMFEKTHLADAFAKIIDQQRAVVALSIGAQIKRIQGNATPEEVQQLKDQVVNQLWSGVNNQQLTDALAQIYSEQFSADELSDLGAFYSTPSGQAVLAKAPAIQAEFSSVLMGQLQSSNPQAVQLIAAFAKAHAAGAAK